MKRKHFIGDYTSYEEPETRPEETQKMVSFFPLKHRMVLANNRTERIDKNKARLNKTKNVTGLSSGYVHSGNTFGLGSDSKSTSDASTRSRLQFGKFNFPEQIYSQVL